MIWDYSPARWLNSVFLGMLHRLNQQDTNLWFAYCHHLSIQAIALAAPTVKQIFQSSPLHVDTIADLLDVQVLLDKLPDFLLADGQVLLTYVTHGQIFAFCITCHYSLLLHAFIDLLAKGKRRVTRAKYVKNTCENTW